MPEPMLPHRGIAGRSPNERPSAVGAPVSDEMRAPLVRPADRYGDTPRPVRRLLGWSAGALAAAAALGYLLWAAQHASTPDVRAGLVSYSGVSDRSVTIRFEVVKEAQTRAVCRVRAVDAQRLVVGSAEVIVGPPRQRERSVVEVTVPTTARAGGVQLTGCERA